MHTILIISKDRRFSRMLELELREAGHTVTRDKDPQDIAGVIALLRSVCFDEDSRPNLVIFDTDLCGKSSVDSLRELSAFLSDAEIKTILISSEELSRDVRSIFFPSVQRCFSRPFSVREFLLEVSRVVGESKPAPGFAEAVPYNAADELRVLSDERTITFRGDALPLTRREYELLAYLLKRRGYTVSREELEDAVWGKDAKTNVADVYIRYLRKKIEEPYHIKLIYTIRGVGYMIRL